MEQVSLPDLSWIHDDVLLAEHLVLRLSCASWNHLGNLDTSQVGMNGCCITPCLVGKAVMDVRIRGSPDIKPGPTT